MVEAVVEALGSSKVRRRPPRWELVERDGPTDEERVVGSCRATFAMPARAATAALIEGHYLTSHTV